MREVGPGGPVVGQLEQPGPQMTAYVVVVVAVEQQGRQVECAVTGKQGRIDVDHAGDRGAVGEEVGQGEVEMDEVAAGRDRRAAAISDMTHYPQQVTQARPGFQGRMQSVAVTAVGQRAEEQIRPAALAVA